MYDGSISFDTSVDTAGFSAGVEDIEDTFDKVGTKAKETAKKVGDLPEALGRTTKQASLLQEIVKGQGVFSLLKKGVDQVVASLDSAVGRYDTMQRFPKMMEQMGYGAEDAQAAVDRLADGVQGLPTTLDSVVSTAQRLTVLTGNLDSATDTTLALNNAFLASGSGAEGASRGLEQYVQMLSKGKVDLESWRTLQETMGLALNRVAESFGFAGESAQTDLYDALQSGEIAFSQFNERLIRLSNTTGGFAEMAKTSSGGIRTAWTNMNTAIVRGAATIIESIDKGLSHTKFQSIENSISMMGKAANNVLKGLVPVFGLVAANADKLAVAIGVLGAAYAANNAINTFTSAQEAASAAMGIAKAAGAVLTPTLNAKAVAEARAAAVTKLGTAATEEQIVAEMAANGVITAKTFALGGLSTGMGVATVATGIMTAATTALSVAVKVLLGPVGLAVIAIGAIGAACVALYQWLTKESEAFEEQSAAVDELAKAQTRLADSAASGAEDAREQDKAIRANAAAAKDLVSQLDALTGAETRTASEKARIAQLVDQLNGQYADLCLAYDEEGNRLSMNTAQLEEYIEAQQTMEQAAALQERYNTLLQEEAMIRENKAELDDKEAELTAQLEQKILRTSEYNDLMEQLAETRAGYEAQEKAFGEQQAALETELAALDTATAQTVIDNAAAQQEAAEKLAAAEEEEMQRRKEALQSYTEAATDMYDRINTKSELSVNDMIANLQANQEAVATWADSLVALGERGLDQGLLQQLRDAGPESAATVAELVTATDEQLATLSETFRAGGQTAVNALQTELGLPEVANAGSEMVDNMAASVTANSALSDAVAQSVTEARESAQAEVASGGFRTIGQQMIQGITAGIAAGQAGLIEAMRGAVREAVNAAKAEADINSPSRLFRRVIGLNIMRGWSLGVQDGEPLVTASVVDAMTALRKEVRSGANPANWVTAMRDTVAYTQAHAAVPAAPMMDWRAPAYAAASPTTIYQTNSFSTHDSLSESELTREAEDMAQRLRWMIP